MEELELRLLEGDAPADLLVGAMVGGDIDGFALLSLVDEMAGRAEMRWGAIGRMEVGG